MKTTSRGFSYLSYPCISKWNYEDNLAGFWTFWKISNGILCNRRRDFKSNFHRIWINLSRMPFKKRESRMPFKKREKILGDISWGFFEWFAEAEFPKFLNEYFLIEFLEKSLGKFEGEGMFSEVSHKQFSFVISGRIHSGGFSEIIHEGISETIPEGNYRINPWKTIWKDLWKYSCEGNYWRNFRRNR